MATLRLIVTKSYSSTIAARCSAFLGINKHFYFQLSSRWQHVLSYRQHVSNCLVSVDIFMYNTARKLYWLLPFTCFKSSGHAPLYKMWKERSVVAVLRWDNETFVKFITLRCIILKLTYMLLVDSSMYVSFNWKICHCGKNTDSDFRLPPRSRWDLCTSGPLRCVSR